MAGADTRQENGYDPQIGRFSEVDSKSESGIAMSVYQFGGNNPVSMNDPLGDKQTAGLYGGTNSYYNFNPGIHSHDATGDWHFANPNDGPAWMNSGDDGGGGGDDGGNWANNDINVESVKVFDPSNFIRNIQKLIWQGYSIDDFDNFLKKNGDLVFSIYYHDGPGYGEIGVDNVVVGYTRIETKESHFWEDLGGTLGGAVETTIGVIGEPETVGTSTFLVADGSDRVLSNGYNLWHDIFPKHSNGNRIPSNLGAQIGASYFGGNGQKWGGIIDDAATMFITGGPLDDGWNGVSNFNSGDYFGASIYWYSAYDGVKTVKDNIDSW